MATKESIWFEYQQAIAQAEALEAIAGSVERTSGGELEEGLRAAASSWSGENSASFQHKGERLQEQFRDTAQALRRAAAEVRQIAERIRRVELANLALAEERSYRN